MPFPTSIPNVPDLPGVPPLARRAGSNAAAAASLLLVQYLPSNIKHLFTGTAPKWGVYDADSNAQSIDADSFLGMRYRNENHISDYPVEQGAFSTYNRVQTPFEVTVSLSKGGTLENRQQFLKQIESAFASIKLFTVITPELIYGNASIANYEYERKSRNGAHFITAHIRFMQVRELPKPGAFAQPKLNKKNKGQISAIAKYGPKVEAAFALSTVANW